MRVDILYYYVCGTKDMFKLSEDMTVNIINQFTENGTDIFFAINEEGKLIYFTPTCITKFYENR